MTNLIKQMHRKSLCKHNGYLAVREADVEMLAVEIAEYCRDIKDPTHFATAIRQGRAQMFGIPLQVQD